MLTSESQVLNLQHSRNLFFYLVGWWQWLVASQKAALNVM
jgi:hypothetical protein